MAANYSGLSHSGLTSESLKHPVNPLTSKNQVLEASKESEALLARERVVFNVLASTVSQDLSDSQLYRSHGQESWSWGDPDEWIKIQWLINALFGRDSALALKQYPTLGQIVNDVQIGELEHYYHLRNAQQVREYLQSYPQLLQFLLDSYKRLRKYFGFEAKFELEVVTDPEVEYQTRFLFVYIRTSLDVDDALARLEQFDDEWYLDRFDKFGALVNFNLDIYEL